MATEKIERLISKEALTSFEDLERLVNANVAGFEKLVAAGVELNSSLGKARSFKEMNAEITKLKENELQLKGTIAELTLAMEALQKKKSEGAGISGTLAKAEKRLQESYSAEARQLSTVREQQILVNKANKQSAQETLGLVDAYRRLELEYNKAERAARNLTIEYGANSKEAKEAVELAQQLDARLKEADYSVGKFGRNVGNYGSALKTLEQYLKDVRAELTQTKAAASGGISVSNVAPAGPAVRSGTGPLRDSGQATQQMVKYAAATKATSAQVEDLQKKEELLSRIVNSQIAGYASATQQLKANEKALQALGQAGLQNSEFYKVLLKDTAELKDSIGDLKQEITALSSDTRQFDLVAGAVTGLVSAVQVGVSVGELFAGTNEDIQKSIQRLTALQNIAQGVQSLANELTTKGTALNKIYNFIIGEGATAKTINTTATTANTVATIANAEAQEAAAVATTGLTTATKVLRGALIASGIGLLIAGIIYLIGKIQEWNEADLNLIKRQAELNAVTLETLRINKELADLYKTDIGTSAQALKNRLQQNQAYGRSQGEILASEEALLKLRQEGAAIKFFDTGGFGAEGKLKATLDEAATAYKNFIKEQAELPKGMKLDSETYNAQKELLQSNLDLAKEKYAEQKVVIDDYVNYNNEVTEKQLQIERLGLDESRKYALFSANLKADTIIESNNRILANDRTTLQQRLALIQSNIDQEKAKARAANRDVQRDPSASKNDRLIAAKTLKAAEAKIEADGNALLEKTREDYRKRDSQATFQSLQTYVDQYTATNDLIKNNEDKALEDRLFAAYENQKAQETLIYAERNLQLETAGLTAKERQAIEDDANAKILQSRMQFTQDVNAITLQDIQKQGDIRLAQADKESSEAILRLNAQFEQGKMSTQQYHQERLKIETKYGALGLQVQIENIQKVIDYYKTQGKDTTQLEADIAAKQKEISDELTEAKIQNLEKLREKQLEVAGELTDLFVSLDESSIEREQANIDKQLEDIDKRKERETAFVNQTIQDAQERADAIAVIEANAQRDKEVLAERQKKLDADKARTDKIVAIAKLTADTAQAVFKLQADAAAARAQAALLLANPVTAAYAPIATASAISIAAQIPLVIGLGAVQLAKIIGTKAFRFGGDVTESGPILVGDNWQSEYGVTKSGSIFKTPAIPSFMEAEAGTTIYPNKRSLEAAIFNNNYSAPLLTDSTSHFKYMTDKLGKGIDRLTKTVKNKKETHITFHKSGWEIMNNNGGSQSDYFKNNLS